MRDTRVARSLVAVAWIGVLSLYGAALAAQPDINTGTRVRVWFTESGRAAHPVIPAPFAIGRVASRATSALQLDITAAAAKAGTQLSVAFVDIERIERSLGRRNHRMRGAIIGGVISAAAFDGFVCAFANGKCAIGSQVAGFLLYSATGAIPGVIIGGTLGSRQMDEERWERVWPGH